MTALQRRILLVAILATFVSGLDSSVVNVALPAISRSLGGGLSVQQWVVDAYLITLGSLILIAGSFSDIFGRKKILNVGLIWFLITSLLCAAAPNGTFLIIARGLQGIGGALLVPSSLALIMSAFSGKAQGKAIGSWTAWTGISFVVGPLLGGLLVDAASWRYIFAINIIPVVVTIWLLRSVAQSEQLHHNIKIDVLGSVLCAAALGLLGYALIEQSRYGWANPQIYGTLLAGVTAFASFIIYEAQSVEPMLPLSLFAVRNFWVGNIATIAIYAGLSIATFLIVIFVQQVGGYSAIKAGLSLIPVTIIMFLLSSKFGSLSGRYGPRIFMTIGPLLASGGFLLMLRVGQPIYYVTELLPGILLFGLGLSITVAPLTSAILGAIEKQRSGIASAVNNAVARIAGLVAIASIGLVTGPRLNLAGFHRGVLLTAFLLTVGGLVSFAGIRTARSAEI